MNWRLIEEDDILNEAAIKPGMSLKHNNYINWNPDYGNVLILAGGAGSGKGFAYDMAIDFQGKKFDVDQLKNDLMKFPIGTRYDKMFFDDYGKHLKDCDLANKDDVFNLHQFCDDIRISDKRQKAFFRSVKELSMSKNELENAKYQKEIRPNIVFDCTMKSISKLVNIVSTCVDAGYDSRCIHIVWILNSHDVARQQNMERPRRVPTDVLDDTHVGVSNTFRKLLEQFNELSDGADGDKIVDGDIWVFFNQRGVDNFTRRSGNGGSEMSEINVVKIKSAGKGIPDFDTIMGMKVKEYDSDGNLVSNGGTTIGEKIGEYVPKATRDAWKKIEK